MQARLAGRLGELAEEFQPALTSDTIDSRGALAEAHKIAAETDVGPFALETASAILVHRGIVEASLLFAGVLILGVPTAYLIFLRLEGPWWRLATLVVAGFVENFVIFAVLLRHPLGGAIAAPVGGFVAFVCCLFNLTELGKPEPRFL